MMIDITQTWWADDMDQRGFVADAAVVIEGPEFSHVLGPDGNPLEYEPHAFGFDLTPRGQR